MKYFIEIVNDQGLYYANVLVGGVDGNGIYHEPRFDMRVREYIPYATLRHELQMKLNIPLPRYKELKWTSHNRKIYSYVEGEIGEYPTILPDVGDSYEVSWRDESA